MFAVDDESLTALFLELNQAGGRADSYLLWRSCCCGRITWLLDRLSGNVANIDLLPGGFWQLRQYGDDAIARCCILCWRSCNWNHSWQPAEIWIPEKHFNKNDCCGWAIPRKTWDSWQGSVSAGEAYCTAITARAKTEKQHQHLNRRAQTSAVTIMTIINPKVQIPCSFVPITIF